MSVWNSSGLDSGEMRAGAQNNTSVVLTSEQQVGENNQQQHPPHQHRHDDDVEPRGGVLFIIVVLRPIIASPIRKGVRQNNFSGLLQGKPKVL